MASLEGGEEGEGGREEDIHMRTLRLTQHLNDDNSSGGNDKAATTVHSIMRRKKNTAPLSS